MSASNKKKERDEYIGSNIPSDLKKKIRVEAARRDMDMSTLVYEILDDHFKPDDKSEDTSESDSEGEDENGEMSENDSGG